MGQAAIALLLAHVLADFVVQTRPMVRAKRRPAVFAAHMAIVGLLSAQALGAATPSVFFACALLALVHGVIDALKLGMNRRVCAAMPDTGPLWLFGVDQAAHLVTIGVFVVCLPWAFHAGSWPILFGHAGADWLAAGMALAAGILVAVRVGDLVLALLLDAVRAGSLIAAPREGHSCDDPQTHAVDSLRAGAWIGRLERGLVFLLVMAGQFSAIGFVIAAKSILRFEHAREPAQGEQVIIGTLASFGWAIGAALATRAVVAALVWP